MPCFYNDNTKGKGNLSIPACRVVNVTSLFNTTLIHHRCHMQKLYHRPKVILSLQNLDRSRGTHQ